MNRLFIAALLSLTVLSCASTQKAPERKQAETEEQKEEIILPDSMEETVPTQKEKVIGRETPPVVVEKAADERYVILNFDDADIRTVIETMGDLLDINYILAPGITGKVTIQSYKKFPVKDLFSIFQSILEMNGLTAVRQKDFYFIMTVEAAKTFPLDVEKGKEVKMRLDSGFITQIIPLEFVKASDAANLLRGLMPRGTDLVVYEPTNLLIVTARPTGLLKFMKILEAIDIAPSERENIRTFVYYVENGEAKNLASILKEIYAQQKGTTRTTTPTTAQRRTIRRTQTSSTPPVPKPAVPTIVGGTAGEVEGEVTISSYEDINALIIKASPASYLAMLETIKKLDIPPKQVLIEVLIAQITLDDSKDMGLEWLLKSEESDGVTAIGGNTPNTLDIDKAATGAVSTTPFAYVIDPGKYVGLINLFASHGKANILASPHILALDNKEAKIEVGDEIPIATGVNSTAAADGGVSSTVSTGQIQYRTTGTLLTVTPHISDKDKVTLKINQEFSSMGSSTMIAGQEYPSFRTRKAQTTGIVDNGHTLIIGGLIREDEAVSQSGIPFLSRIPIIGFLFGSRNTAKSKTELVIMVTPHVVRDAEEADALTHRFKEKVHLIKSRLSVLEREDETNDKEMK